MDMKVRNFIIVFVIVFGVIAAGGSYSWALAAPPEREAPTATVTVDGGEAWIRKGGTGDWITVGSDVAVGMGDRVKTGAGGSATVDFFGGAVARLDADTEVVVNDLAIDEDNSTRERIAVGVVAGRVWSRVMKFMDQESSYSVESSEVVATVRGTAFSVEPAEGGGVLVRVADSNVAVSLKGSGEEQLVAPGEEAFVAAAASSSAAIAAPLRKVLRRKFDLSALGVGWYSQMMRADEEFVSRLKEREGKRLRTAAGILPGSPFYGLKRLGERLRTALVSDQETRRDMELRYADRRFAEIATLQSEGRGEVAKRMLEDFHRRYVRTLSDIEGKRLSGDAADKACLVLKGRFMEQDLAIRNLGRDDLGDLLSRLDRPPQDLRVMPRALRDRVCSGTKRLPDFKPILPTVIEVKDDAATGTGGAVVNAVLNVNSPLVNKPIANVNANLPVVNQPTNQPAGAPQVLRISVTGQRTMLYLPDSQQMKAVAYMSDGTTKDVTALSSWASSDEAIMTAAGGMVVTKGIGTASVSASSGGVTGSASLRVLGSIPTATVTLQSLAVSCSPSTLDRYATNLASATCAATARYSDGSTKDVTSSASWSVSANLGSMRANVFVSNSVPGTATVAASYAGETATVSGSATVVVQ